MPAFPASTLTTLAYPRTGKRGVPQQFPRRLYEMLESEAKLAQTESTHEKIICWSETGKAFRILDVTRFAAFILPKYFRTCKFSSFQRNLNLYGFSKIRRGPDTDMYSHPLFIRGKAENLSQLRKCTSAAARKKTTSSLQTSSIPSNTYAPEGTYFRDASSPSPPQLSQKSQVYPILSLNSPTSTMTTPTQTFVVGPPAPTFLPQSPPSVTQFQVLPKKESSGKLNLLAMAMTSMEERDQQARYLSQAQKCG